MKKELSFLHLIATGAEGRILGYDRADNCVRFNH
jgi:hypothetical protein